MPSEYHRLIIEISSYLLYQQDIDLEYFIIIILGLISLNLKNPVSNSLGL